MRVPAGPTDWSWPTRTSVGRAGSPPSTPTWSTPWGAVTRSLWNELRYKRRSLQDRDYQRLYRRLQPLLRSPEGNPVQMARPTGAVPHSPTWRHSRHDPVL